tara:strand:+ start:463 stop:636 length:174 start_codon:yes stop_codon:yes gene_type:complete
VAALEANEDDWTADAAADTFEASAATLEASAAAALAADCSANSVMLSTSVALVMPAD